MCGDFNAHSPLWGSAQTNNRGNKFSLAMEEGNLIPLNDHDDTYIPRLGEAGSNLDLVLCSPSLVPAATYNIGQDSFRSDHIPVIVEIFTKPTTNTSKSHRLNIKNVNWVDFQEKVNMVTNSIDSATNAQTPEKLYREVMDGVYRTLLECGAYHSGQIKGKRKTQPLWWNKRGIDLLVSRRNALQNYLKNQTVDELRKF